MVSPPVLVAVPALPLSPPAFCPVPFPASGLVVCPVPVSVPDPAFFPLPASVPEPPSPPSSCSGGAVYLPMPAAAFKETAPLLVIVAWFVSSLSIRTVALFFTLLTKTAAPISTLALASEFFTVNCKASSLSVVAVMIVLALILTEPSGAGGVVGVVSSPVCCAPSPVCALSPDGVPLGGVVSPVVGVPSDGVESPESPATGFVAVITTFFPMVTLALFVLETTPTLAPRPKAEVLFAFSPPSLVPSTLSFTFWMAPSASWVCVS